MNPSLESTRLYRHFKLVHGMFLLVFSVWSVVSPLGWAPWTAEATSVHGSLQSQGSSASVLHGLIVDTDNPFRFQLLFDPKNQPKEQWREDARRFAGYFLAGLTLPPDKVWVNLSPYEKDRMAPTALLATRVGEDLLAQDFVLKQVTASLLHPKGETGRRFWSKVYAAAAEKGLNGDIPVETFNKVWIVPDDAAVYAHDGTVVITHATLRVQLAQDHVLSRHGRFVEAGHFAEATQETAADLARMVMREVVLPVLKEEVNSSEQFAPLRQIYRGMILAVWFKQTLKQHLLQRLYIDRAKIQGLDPSDSEEINQVYQQYLEMFRSGAYQLIQAETDPVTQKSILRRYMVGGSRVQPPNVKGVRMPPSGDVIKSFVAALIALHLAGGTALGTTSPGLNDGNAATIVTAPAAVVSQEGFVFPQGFDQADKNLQIAYHAFLAGMLSTITGEVIWDESVPDPSLLDQLYKAILEMDDDHPLWRSFQFLTGAQGKGEFAVWIGLWLQEVWRHLSHQPKEKITDLLRSIEPPMDHGEWEMVFSLYHDGPANLLNALQVIDDLRQGMDPDVRSHFEDMIQSVAKSNGPWSETEARVFEGVVLGLANWLFPEPPDVLLQQSFKLPLPPFPEQTGSAWDLKLHPHQQIFVSDYNLFGRVLERLGEIMGPERLKGLISRHPLEVLYMIKLMAFVSVHTGDIDKNRAVDAASLVIWKNVLGERAIAALFEHPMFFLVYDAMIPREVPRAVSKFEGFDDFVDAFSRKIGWTPHGLRQWLDAQLKNDPSVLNRRAVAELIVNVLILPYFLSDQEWPKYFETMAQNTGSPERFLKGLLKQIRERIKHEWQQGLPSDLEAEPIHNYYPFPPAMVPPSELGNAAEIVFAGLNAALLTENGIAPAGLWLAYEWYGPPILIGKQFLPGPPVPKPYQILPGPPVPRPYQYLPGPPVPRPYVLIPKPRPRPFNQIPIPKPRPEKYEKEGWPPIPTPRRDTWYDFRNGGEKAPIPKPKPRLSGSEANSLTDQVTAAFIPVWHATSVVSANSSLPPGGSLPLVLPFFATAFGVNGGRGSSSSLPSSDRATTRRPGGIDLREEVMNVTITEEGKIGVLPDTWNALTPDDIPGLVPVILEIAPVTNLPQLLGLEKQKDGELNDETPMASEGTDVEKISRTFSRSRMRYSMRQKRSIE